MLFIEGLEVGYYEWKIRPVSETEKYREDLTLMSRAIFDDSHETYGHRRIHTVLTDSGYDEPERIRQLSDLLKGELRDISPFSVTCDPALAGVSSIALDMVPNAGFAEVRGRAREAAGKVFGAEAVTYSSGRLRVTFASATGEGDSGAIQAQLQNATDLRTQLTVDRVNLVDVRVDMDRMRFSWDELSVHPLAG